MHSGSEFLVPGTSQQAVGTGTRGGGAREVKWATQRHPAGSAATATRPALSLSLSLFFIFATFNFGVVSLRASLAAQRVKNQPAMQAARESSAWGHGTSRRCLLSTIQGGQMQGTHWTFSLHLVSSRQEGGGQGLMTKWGGGKDELEPRNKMWVQSPNHEDTLENEMDTHSSILAWETPGQRGAWWATVPGVTQSWTQLSD